MLQSLDHEKNKLLKTIQEQELTLKQIENIFEFAKQIKEGLEYANEGFTAKREIIDAPDVHVIISVEGKEKIVYAECVLGEISHKLEKSNTNDDDSDSNFRNNLTSIYANFWYRNPLPAHPAIVEFIPARARHRPA